MSETLTLITASLAWFTPLAAIRVYENAYILGYTGVNLATLSMTFILMALLAVTYLMVPRPTGIGIFASLYSWIGLSVMVAGG